MLELVVRLKFNYACQLHLLVRIYVNEFIYVLAIVLEVSMLVIRRARSRIE